MFASPYHWWVQSVMPVVFDDSLSYYEVLAKLTKYMEGVVSDVDQIEKILATIEGIEDITQFVEFLETIQTEIGTLSNLSTNNKSDLVSAINEVAQKANNAYVKPMNGIPESDLSQEVRDKLDNSGGAVSYIINNKTLKPAPSNNSPADLGLGTYSVPNGGIPEDTLSQEVRDKLNAGGSGGTGDYNELINKPQINGHTLNAGNNSSEALGLGTYSKPLDGIPESDLSEEVVNKLNTSGGIANENVGMIAQRDYEIGELVYIDGVLYKTTMKILTGSNFVIGNNIIATDINDELLQINSKIDKMASGEGLDSWSLVTELTPHGESPANAITFFEYIRCTGGENYLFIATRLNGYSATYYIKIYKRDGTLVDAFQNPEINQPQTPQARHTFTPVETGDYYCTITGSRYAEERPYIRVELEYTQSQGISELWNQVNQATTLEPRLAAVEGLVETQQGNIESLEDDSFIFRGFINRLGYTSLTQCVKPGWYSCAGSYVSNLDDLPIDYPNNGAIAKLQMFKPAYAYNATDPFYQQILESGDYIWRRILRQHPGEISPGEWIRIDNTELKESINNIQTTVNEQGEEIDNIIKKFKDAFINEFSADVVRGKWYISGGNVEFSSTGTNTIAINRMITLDYDIVIDANDGYKFLIFMMKAPTNLGSDIDIYTYFVTHAEIPRNTPFYFEVRNTSETAITVDEFSSAIRTKESDIELNKKVDLIIFAGQSNMAGRGVTNATWPERAPTIIPGAGYEYKAISQNPGYLVNIEEPFGRNENNPDGINDGTQKTGSMVTSFVNAYYTHNGGIPVVAVSASKGGSAISEWQPATPYLTDAVNRLDLAKTWLTEHNFEIRNIFMMWCQGEHEAGTETEDDDNNYITDFQSMFTIFKEHGVTKCLLVRIGEINNADESAIVIQKQTEMAQTDPDIIMVTTDLASFRERGLMKDNYHFYQAAYNEAGTYSGINAAQYVVTGKEPTMYDPKYNNLYYSHIN